MTESDEAILLQLHEQVLQAHRAGDISAWLVHEAERFVVANRGEVTWPTMQERQERMGPYLARTQFSEYKDLIPPIVRVAGDGSLGWVIAQVKAAGVQQSPQGEEVSFEFVSAWIELYARQEGQWLRIGNVSNFKPQS